MTDWTACTAYLFILRNQTDSNTTNLHSCLLAKWKYYYTLFFSLFSLNLCPFFFSGCGNPKPCQTELTVLEYGLYDGDPVTKVLLQPLTGNSSHLFPLV